MIKSFFILILSALIFFESLLPKGIGISEGAKIGEIYSHYVSHKTEGVGFVKFLWLHFSSDSKHKEKNEHKKFPKFDTQISFIISFNLKTKIFEFKELKNRIIDYKTTFFYCNNYKYKFQNSFLNPPRNS